MEKLRFSILTLNLWNTERWVEREPAVLRFLETFRPDICCFQELRSNTASVIDRCLTGHDRVRDPFAGWLDEGNIYYNRELFRELEHGAVDLSMPEKDRRLFWVRLQVSDTGATILVSNVHLTHQGNADEIATGRSYRHDEATIMARTLPGFVRENEGAIVCGDFNDPIHPVRILSGVGFSEVFNALGLLPPVTFPSRPATDEIIMNEAIDKLMSRGPLRPVLASVPQYYAYRTSVSDHWPVVAVYEITAYPTVALLECGGGDSA
jgi:endonuclease/exonuclease/phosphatase family metal-dependent hydrolase